MGAGHRHRRASAPMPDPARKQHYSQNKLHKRLRRNVGQRHPGLSNDRPRATASWFACPAARTPTPCWTVLVSLQRSAPVDFELVAVNLDQKQPGFPEQVLPDYLRARGMRLPRHRARHLQRGQEVVPEGKTMCGLCSRLRRGALYRFAQEHGIDQDRAGPPPGRHPRDLLLSTCSTAGAQGMPAKVEKRRFPACRHTSPGLLPRARYRRYAQARQFPIIPCKLCGSQTDSERRMVKEMLAEWQRTAPGRIESIARALAHVVPSHLADPELFDFRGLEVLAQARS